MHSSTVDHWSFVKRILRYLKYMSHHGLFLSPNSNIRLQAFSNADWAGDPLDRKSTCDCIYLGKNLISWCSRKQRTVARSSTEAEYKAIADAAAEITWLQSLFKEVGFSQNEITLLWCNNIGATYFFVNPIFHA